MDESVKKETINNIATMNTPRTIIKDTSHEKQIQSYWSVFSERRIEELWVFLASAGGLNTVSESSFEKEAHSCRCSAG